MAGMSINGRARKKEASRGYKSQNQPGRPMADGSPLPTIFKAVIRSPRDGQKYPFRIWIKCYNKEERLFCNRRE